MTNPDMIVGRAQEIEEIRRAVDRFVSGNPQIVLLEGDVGVGKSTLVRYVRTLVQERTSQGCDWLAGAAPGPDPGLCPDFVIWSDTMDQWARKALPTTWLRRLWADFGSELAEEFAVALSGGIAFAVAASFIEAVPEFIGFIAGVTVAVTVRRLLRVAGRKRRKTSRTMGGDFTLGPDEQLGASNANRIVLHLSSHFQRDNAKPVVFALEDLQWADPSSLALLSSILRSCKPGWKLLVVITHRAGEALPSSAPFFGFSIRLREQPFEALETKRLVLAPLSVAAGADLVRILLDTKDSDLARWVAARTAGIPLFIRQFCRLLQEKGWVSTDGVLVYSGGIRGLDTDLAEGRIPSPDAIEAVLDRRLSALDENQRRVLAFLGFEGSPAHESFLMRAISEHGGVTADKRSIQRIVSQCVSRHGLLTDLGPHEALGRLYGFEHEFVRDAANRLLVEPERSAVQETLVEWLIELWSSPAFSPPPQEDRGLFASAFGYSLGDRTRIIDRLVEAVPLEGARTPDGLDVVQLYLEASNLQLEVGNVSGAKTLLDALIRALRNGNVRADPVWTARVLLSAGRISIKQGQNSQAIALMQDGLGQAQAAVGSDAPILRGWLRFERARAMRLHGSWDAAIQEVDEALEEFEAPGTDDPRAWHIRGRLLQEKGLTLHLKQNDEEAMVVFEQAIESQDHFARLSPGPSSAMAQAWSLISAIKTTRRLGRLDEDLRMSKKALQIAQHHCIDPDDRDHQQLLAYANAYYAYSLKKTSPEQAEVHQGNSLRIRERLALDPEDLEVRRDLAVDLSIYGEILTRLGKLNEALSVRQRSREIREDLAVRGRGSQNLRLLATEYGYLAQLFLKLGQPEQALEAAKKSLATEKDREEFSSEPERVEKAKITVAELEAKLAGPEGEQLPSP